MPDPHLTMFRPILGGEFGIDRAWTLSLLENDYVDYKHIRPHVVIPGTGMAHDPQGYAVSLLQEVEEMTTCQRTQETR